MRLPSRRRRWIVFSYTPRRRDYMCLFGFANGLFNRLVELPRRASPESVNSGHPQSRVRTADLNGPRHARRLRKRSAYTYSPASAVYGADRADNHVAFRRVLFIPCDTQNEISVGPTGRGENVARHT